MDSSRSPAPADHLNPQRLDLADLEARLVALRKALPLLQRVASGAHHGALSAFAALAAYLPAQALGLKQAFWAALTAIAVVQSEFRATQTMARDQFIGASVGGVTGLCAILVLGDGLAVYATAVVLAMVFCWAANVASASRLAGITATIIVLVPRVESPERMFAARILEVGWGVSVAIIAVWLAARLPVQRAARRAALTRPPAP